MTLKTTLKIFDEHGVIYDTAATFGRRSFKLGDVVTDRRSLRVDPVEDTTERVVRGLLRTGFVREAQDGGPFEVKGSGGAVLGDELDQISLRVVRMDEDEGAHTYTLEVSIPESALERPGLASGRQSSRASRSNDVAKARAAMTAAAAEMTARDRLQRDQTRNVRIAVAALSMRPQGVRPASMGEVDVYEALARHGLAEATGRGNTHRTGHLTAIASTLLTAQDHADALAALEDAPQH